MRVQGVGRLGMGAVKKKKKKNGLTELCHLNVSHPIRVLGFEPEKCVCLRVKKCWVGGGLT